MEKRFPSRVRREYLALGVFALLLTLAAYGAHAMSVKVGIDTEQWIIGEYKKQWIVESLGRFGYYFTALFFNARAFSPWMNGLMLLLLFPAGGLALLGLLDGAGGFRWKRSTRLLFLTVYLTQPVWALQFYFSLQQTAICFALLCCAGSLWLLTDAMDSAGESRLRRGAELLVSLGLAFWAFGTYQALPGVYLTLAAGVLFQRFLHREQGEGIGRLWRTTGLFALHFLASLGLYYGVCRLMGWGTSSYLSFAWGRTPAGEIFRALTEDLKWVLQGRGDTPGWVYPAAAAVLGALYLWGLRKRTGAGEKLTGLFLLLAVLLAPFSLNLALGTPAVDRAKLALPPALACLGALALEGIREELSLPALRRGAAAVLGGVLVLSAGLQAHRLETLFYTDEICNQQQYETGAELVRRMQAQGGCATDTVILVGKWEAPLNPACLRQSTIGASSFCWDYTPDKPTSATRRGVQYLRAAFGQKYNLRPTKAQKAEAEERARSMATYPAEGSVTREGELVVIRLSDDWAEAE